MEDDQEQRPESLLPYEQWTETALRQVVAQAITHVAVHGLPGDHHFYMTFRTDHPGVAIPPRLRAQYPQEMTIVLQHQFWDLKMDERGRADQRRPVVRRRAGDAGDPARRGVGFADPHVRYGLRFHVAMPEAPAEKPLRWCRRRSRGAVPAETPSRKRQPKPPQVVSLDAFRRRTPPKDA